MESDFVRMVALPMSVLKCTFTQPWHIYETVAVQLPLEAVGELSGKALKYVLLRGLVWVGVTQAQQLQKLLGRGLD